MKPRRIVSLVALVGIALCVTGARDFNGSSQYANVAAAPVSAEPATVAIWMRPAATNASIFALSVNASATSKMGVGVTATGGAPFAQCADTSGGTVGTAAGPGGQLVVDQWAHVVGTFPSSTERIVWLNGNPVATNTTSVTVSGLDRVLIGARVTSSAVGAYFNGDLAEAAVWNVVLTSSEIASLAAGAKPYRVRPSALVMYVPLIGASPENNWKGVGATLTNAPTTGSHPRVY